MRQIRTAHRPKTSKRRRRKIGWPDRRLVSNNLCVEASGVSAPSLVICLERVGCLDKFEKWKPWCTCTEKTTYTLGHLNWFVAWLFKPQARAHCNLSLYGVNGSSSQYGYFWWEGTSKFSLVRFTKTFTVIRTSLRATCLFLYWCWLVGKHFLVRNGWWQRGLSTERKEKARTPSWSVCILRYSSRHSEMSLSP